jgi:hypothetical protein
MAFLAFGMGLGWVWSLVEQLRLDSRERAAAAPRTRRVTTATGASNQGKERVDVSAGSNEVNMCPHFVKETHFMRSALDYVDRDIAVKSCSQGWGWRWICM